MARGLAYAMLATILGVVALANAGMLSLTVVSAVPHADKWGHFLLYALLALSCELGNRADGRPGRASVLIVVLLGVEELTQLATPLRTFSGWDVAAGMAGVGTALAALRFRERRARRDEHDNALKGRQASSDTLSVPRGLSLIHI